MRSSKLVLTSVIAAISLAVYALESLIPPIVPVPGVKLGLANAITLIALYVLGAKCALQVLAVRIFIASLLFGQPVSWIFSISGGLLSFGVMFFLKRFVDDCNIWALSVFGAFAHNLGQIVVAIVITGQIEVAYYFLILVISSVITGVFTGICAQSAIKKLKKINLF
ncbi:MAG: Gx transporter family protein [Clostridia bacterium]|nr:Gx transporter family protein [Clostridia bacterium]